MERDKRLDGVLRSLRRVNFQGSLFGQTIAIRLGLSESDIEALGMLIDSGAATAGRLSELLGLSTGAVTRLIDRLEQAGYVRRVPDPADRRRVVIEVVPEKAASVESLLGRVAGATVREIGRYSPDQLALIDDFLHRMADATRAETDRLRDAGESAQEESAQGEHSAPLGGLEGARLAFRAGAPEVRLRADPDLRELYRARFEGAMPHVRVRDGTVSVHYKGLPFDWRKRRADMTLNAAIPWTIDLQGGASRVTAELAPLDLRSFELVGGAGRLDLALGSPHGAVPIRVVGGSSDVRLVRPSGIAVRLRLIGGSGRIELDGQRIGASAGETRLESSGAEEAVDLYAVEIVGGVGKVSVNEARQ